MLGQHSEAFAFPELILFSGRTVEEAVRAGYHGPQQPNRQRLVGLVRALAQANDGNQESAALSAAARWLQARRNWPIEFVLDHLFASVSPLRAIEKSPDTTNNDANLTRAMNLYPDARYLHLVRHPITTITSMINHWRSLPWAQELELSNTYPATVARHWLLSQRRIIRFATELPHRQYLRIRAEDAINRPQETLPALARSLMLSDDARNTRAMMRPERSLFAYPGGGNDPGFLQDPRLRRLIEPDRWTIPKWWGLTEETEEALRLTARLLGYRPEASTPLPERA